MAINGQGGFMAQPIGEGGHGAGVAVRFRYIQPVSEWSTDLDVQLLRAHLGQLIHNHVQIHNGKPNAASRRMDACCRFENSIPFSA